MNIRLTTYGALLGMALLIPAAAQAGDYQGGEATPQSSRESNTHSPGMGMSQGSLDKTLFDQLDRNQDGTLNGEELDAYGEPAAGNKKDEKQRLLERYDEDENGMISQEEFDKGKE